MTSQRKSQRAEGTHALLQASSGRVPHRSLVLRREGRSRVRPVLGGALESAGRRRVIPCAKVAHGFLPIARPHPRNTPCVRTHAVQQVASCSSNSLPTACPETRRALIHPHTLLVRYAVQTASDASGRIMPLPKEGFNYAHATESVDPGGSRECGGSNCCRARVPRTIRRKF